MPDQWSGVTSGSLDSLALLAVTAAVAAALSARERGVVISKLAAITEDWERDGAAGELHLASRQVLRPVLTLLRQEYPERRRIRLRPPRRDWRSRAPRG